MPFLEMPKPNLPEDDPDQDRLGSLPYYISSDGKSYSAGEAFEILKKSDAKFLGDGFECLVVTFPNLPDKAIAYSFWNPSENFDATRAKTTFYVHRIFSTLFPHNFPKIHAAFGENGDKNKGTVRELIKKKENSDIENASIETDEDSSSFFKNLLHGIKITPTHKNKQESYPFEAVSDFFELILQAKDYLYFDGNENNIIEGEDGGEYFVDTVNTFEMGDDKSIRNLLISKQSDIIKYMEHLKFSDSDIRKVNNAIERLKTIEDEYRKSKTA